MDMALISVITAGIGALVTWVAPKLVRRTKTKVDDKIVEYVRAHLPEIVEYVEGQLKDKPAPRPGARDHRGA